MSETSGTEDTGGPESVWDAAAAAFGRWRDGDAAALDELVRLLSPVLWQVVRATGLDHEAAEDVVQTAWLALVKGADAITTPQAVAGWLCTSARREAWRVSKLAGRQRPTDDEVLQHRLPAEPGPERQVVLDDEGARLWEALDRLSERCRQLLRIVAAEPRPDYADISAQLGMPVGSIGPTRGRCLEKLRHELVQAGGL